MPPWLGRGWMWVKEDKTYGSREGLHWYYHGHLALLLPGLGRGLQPTCHVGHFTRFFKDPPHPLHQWGSPPYSLHWWISLFSSWSVRSPSSAPGVISVPPASFCPRGQDLKQPHNIFLFLTLIHRKYWQDYSGFPNHSPPDILWLSKYLRHESHINPLIYQALGNKKQILPEVPLKVFSFGLWL